MTHGPVEPEFKEQMNALAHWIDEFFNRDRKGEDRENGFVLLCFRFGEIEAGRMNYISNADREDVRVALRELLSQWEGMKPPESKVKQ